jgi:hypothetical protein
MQNDSALLRYLCDVRHGRCELWIIAAWDAVILTTSSGPNKTANNTGYD